MKKLFTLLAALTLAGTASADLVPDGSMFTYDASNYLTSLDQLQTGYYLIQNQIPNGPYWMYQDLSATNTPLKRSGTKTTSETPANKNVFKLTVTVTDGVYAVQIQGFNENYVFTTTSNSETTATASEATTYYATWANDTHKTFYLRSESTGGYYLQSNGDPMWKSGTTGDWAQYKLFPVTIVEGVNVTYTVKYNGTTVDTATATQPIGNAPSVPSTLAKDFVNYTYNVETLSASTTEVTAEGTWAGPFEISTDYASAKWYNLNLRYDDNNHNLTYADGSDPNITLGALTNSGMDAVQQWAFTGDPYTGFKLINNAAGSTHFAASANVSGNGGSTYLYLTDDNTTYPEDLWTVKSSSYRTNGFFLFNESNVALNLQNNKVVYWTGGYDIGSTFVVSKAPTYADLVASNIKPYYDGAGTGYFLLSETGKTALDGAGYTDALTSCDQTTYNNLLEIVNNNIQYPATGYYRIKSSGSAEQGTVGYIGLGSNSYNRGNEATGYGLKTIVTNPDQDASTVIYLEEKDATAHTYTISTQNEWATGATDTNNPILMTADKASAGVFTIGAVTGYPGYCDIKQPTAVSKNGGSYQYFHEAGWGNDVSCVCVWESGATAAPSRWQIEDVADDAQVMTPTLHEASGSYYATLNLPYGATVEGAKANYATLDASGSYLDLTEISEIPANTPVVLIGNAATATVKLKSNASAEVENNALTGNYFPITWTTTNLTLGSVDDATGFYLWSDGTTLSANKAYYVPANANVRGLAFRFGGEATGIQSAVTTNATNGKVYDLQGRRVMNAQKGLYIVGGKKVLVK